LHSAAASLPQLLDEIRIETALVHLPALSRQLHRLKGIAGTIGADSVQGLANELESLLRDSASHLALSERLESLRVELQRVVRTLALLPAEQPAELEMLSITEFAGLLAELADKLQQRNFAAGRLAERLAASNFAAHYPALSAIKAMTDRLDYSSAGQRVSELLEQTATARHEEG